MLRNAELKELKDLMKNAAAADADAAVYAIFSEAVFLVLDTGTVAADKK